MAFYRRRGVQVCFLVEFVSAERQKYSLRRSQTPSSSTGRILSWIRDNKERQKWKMVVSEQSRLFARSLPAVYTRSPPFLGAFRENATVRLYRALLEGNLYPPPP